MPLPSWVPEIQSERNRVRHRRQTYFKMWATIGITLVLSTAYYTLNGIAQGKPIDPFTALAPLFIMYLSLFGIGLYAGELKYGPIDRLAANLFELADWLTKIGQDEAARKEVETVVARMVSTFDTHRRSLKKQELVNSNAIKFLTSLKTILLKTNRLSQLRDITRCNDTSTSIAAIAQMVHLGNLNSYDIITLSDAVLTNLQNTDELVPQSPMAKLPSAIANQLGSNSKFRLAIEIPVSVVFAIVLGTDNTTRALLAVAALTLIIAIEAWQRPKKNSNNRS